MTRKTNANVNAANQYARDVVRGKISVCRYVVLACQRHLDDLEKAVKKNYPYKFDKERAERVAKFIQLLPHTKGEWAFKRMPITLEPWQLFIICTVFGWVHKKTGYRRFREAYNEIPRKNGKSAITAGIGLYMFAADDEFGAEVYSGATTEKQAWEVFRPARLMAQRTEALREAFGIEVHAQSLSRPEDGARFEPLIGNPGDGSSPSAALIDEYHEHTTYKSQGFTCVRCCSLIHCKIKIFFVFTFDFDRARLPCYGVLCIAACIAFVFARIRKWQQKTS